jgi:hypothetical protein
MISRSSSRAAKQFLSPDIDIGQLGTVSLYLIQDYPDTGGHNYEISRFSFGVPG